MAETRQSECPWHESAHAYGEDGKSWFGYDRCLHWGDAWVALETNPFPFSDWVHAQTLTYGLSCEDKRPGDLFPAFVEEHHVFEEEREQAWEYMVQKMLDEVPPRKPEGGVLFHECHYWVKSPGGGGSGEGRCTATCWEGKCDTSWYHGVPQRGLMRAQRAIQSKPIRLVERFRRLAKRAVV